MRYLEARHQPKTSARRMLAAKGFQPIDEATAAERFAHIPVETER